MVVVYIKRVYISDVYSNTRLKANSRLKLIHSVRVCSSLSVKLPS